VPVTLPGYMGAIYSRGAKLGGNGISFYLLCLKEEKEKQLSVLGSLILCSTFLPQ